MMASSVKRERCFTEEYENTSPFLRKKPRLANHRVVLNPADCDLDFDIGENGLQGCALYEDAFSYCWSGARANIGITGGKYCFSCKVVDTQPVNMDDTPFDQTHLCRVGVSKGGDNSVGKLGETEDSFGFGGTGKFSNNGRFSIYGEKFGIGDIILCVVDLESKPMGSVSFAKNGKWLGIATYFKGDSNWKLGVFPHVLLKNVVVQLQFSCEDGLVPQYGFKPWACAFEDGNGLMGPSLCDGSNCELIMMVGLPASGKTTWAERWVNEHPEKRYILLGTNYALNQMKVPGLVRKQNYGERFDRLMERATAICNNLLTRASKIPRNFIIDQTNVYKSARRRKLKSFANYQKIAVVVFPRPEELKTRSEKRFREMGKELPAEAVNEMLANFVLPKSKNMHGADEYFDQIVYIELDMIEAERCLDEMKAKLQMDSSVSSYSRESSLMVYSQYSQENILQPQKCSAHEYPLNSCSHFSQSTSGHYAQGNSLLLHYQTTPSGGQMQGPNQSQLVSSNKHQEDPSKDRFLRRDDFNHRRSYSGYYHRAAVPVSIPERNSSYHTPSSEAMDLSPRYTENLNHHAAPVNSYARSTSSIYDVYGGSPQVDMQTPIPSRFRSAIPVPHGSTYGTPDPVNPYGNHITRAPNCSGYHSRSSYY